MTQFVTDNLQKQCDVLTAKGSALLAVDYRYLDPEIIKDRLRSMRGLGSVETGQRLLEGIELAQAVQRGDVRPPHQHPPGSVHERSRFEAATFSWLASGMRTAA